MKNKLANENSPYLLQHADNPVNWYPWGPEALEKARAEDKPIFLSIGYTACHWCHVMAHESFEDAITADLMNEHFINIKVDREERPDLDSIYMSAVVAMTGQGGWPMSVFLTPNMQPFFGGTYFPPARRYNMPSFREVLQTIIRLWRDEREQIINSSLEIMRHLEQQNTAALQPLALQANLQDQATLALAQAYDWKHGGWGQAPKFPQPMTIEYLLLRANQGDKMALEMALHALRAMARGGMYDVVGGGFARYSTDNKWLIPHFEKMLYDNAQLALAYLHAYLLTGAADLRQVCEETLDFTLHEMTNAQGGFYASLDADSEGEEGRFYTWTAEEIADALANEQDSAFFTAAYGVTASGNFDQRTVLQRLMDDDALAERFRMRKETVRPLLSRLHQRLLAHRGQRVRPVTDDKVLTAWNGLMLRAMAEAGRYLGRTDYTNAAIRNGQFLLSELYCEGYLKRSWREGVARHNALLEDHAALVLGLLALYQTDAQVRWFSAALELTQAMVLRFVDPAGGFFDTSNDHERLLLRPKDLQDNATPCGSSLAAMALLQMSAYTGNGEWRDTAEAMLASIQSLTVRYPTAFGQWLSAAHLVFTPILEVAIVGTLDDPQTQAFTKLLWKKYRPEMVVAVAPVPLPEGCPALLDGRGLLNGQPTAYVCQKFTCQAPVNTADALAKQLGD
ncbi:MAG: thioredoxin domain-containing protein [Anaerolineales bacterium]|nr:thioredoxin domain-containing protein [Anaerolineales bacterium]